MVPVGVDLVDCNLRVPVGDGFGGSVHILELTPDDELVVMRMVPRPIIGAVGVGDEPDRLKLVLLGQEAEGPLGDVGLVEGRAPHAQSSRAAGHDIQIGAVGNGGADELLDLGVPAAVRAADDERSGPLTVPGRGGGELSGKSLGAEHVS